MTWGMLLFWIGSVVASYSMEFVNELRMVKDAADAGYKIDFKKLDDAQKSLLPINVKKLSTLSMFLPIVNFLTVIKNVFSYNEARPVILDQFRVMGCLEEMSDIEMKEYSKKPTGFNAMLVSYKAKAKLDKAYKLHIKDGFICGDIYYEIVGNFEDVNIVSVTGSLTRYSEKELKKMIFDSFSIIFKFNAEENNIDEAAIKAIETLLKSDSNTLLSEEDDKKEEFADLDTYRKKDVLIKKRKRK